jgi:hypothetical protein
MASNQVGREASRAVVNEHDLCHFRPERVLDVSSSSSAFLVFVLLSLSLYSRLLSTFTTAFRSISHHATCTSLTNNNPALSYSSSRAGERGAQSGLGRKLPLSPQY